MLGNGAAREADEPLRVVFFTASYFVLDGVTLTIRKILAHLKSIGAETLVITAAPIADTMGELGALDGENLVLVSGMPVPMENEHYGYALGLGLSAEARRRLAEFKPHVAHFTVCDLLGMDGVAWARKNHVALVGTWHSNYCDYVKFYSGAWWLVPVLRRYIQQFYGAIPTTYVPTENMRRKLIAEGYDRFTCMEVWGRGIDLDRFDSATRRSRAFRTRHGVREVSAAQRAAFLEAARTHRVGDRDGHHRPHGAGSAGAASADSSADSSAGSSSAGVAVEVPREELLILWVGRLVPEKRPDIWRDVVTRLAVAEGLPVKGLVVGVGPEQAMLERCEPPGLVTVAGWLSGVDLAEAYASSDVLLFPSDVETFGNVTLEALGSGTPAVVEAKCSAHLVADGVEGFAVEQNISDPNDKAAYAACVDRYCDATRRLVLDAQLRAQCGVNALKKAHTYSNGAVQQRMVDNYTAAYASQVEPWCKRSQRRGHNVKAGGGNGSGSSLLGAAGGGADGADGAAADDDDDAEDPNDKNPVHRLRLPLLGVGGAGRRLHRTCRAATAACFGGLCGGGGGGGGGLTLQHCGHALCHHFFAVGARVVIFLLWLLLGMPSVTTTDMADTNIRAAATFGGGALAGRGGGAGLGAEGQVVEV